MAALVRRGQGPPHRGQQLRRRAAGACEAIRHVDTFQPQLNLLVREARGGRHPLVRGPRHRGHRLQPDALGAADRRASRRSGPRRCPMTTGAPSDPDFQEPRLDPNLALVDALGADRRRAGRARVAELAVAWTLAWPGVRRRDRRRPPPRAGRRLGRRRRLRARRRPTSTAIAAAVAETGRGSGPARAAEVTAMTAAAASHRRSSERSSRPTSPQHDVDVAETTRHATAGARTWPCCGPAACATLRYPVRWHRVEERRASTTGGRPTRCSADARARACSPSSTSPPHELPRWIEGGFADPRFGDAYLRFSRRSRRATPGCRATPCSTNPSPPSSWRAARASSRRTCGASTASCGWLTQRLPAINEASSHVPRPAPGGPARQRGHVERHSAALPAGEAYAAYANDRRFAAHRPDLGRDLDPDRPFLRETSRSRTARTSSPSDPATSTSSASTTTRTRSGSSAAGSGGGRDLPKPGRARRPHRRATGAATAWRARSVRPTFAAMPRTGRQLVQSTPWSSARTRDGPHRGECRCSAPALLVPVHRLCDWASLLRRADGAMDPVGVFWIDTDWNRRTSTMSESYLRPPRGRAPRPARVPLPRPGLGLARRIPPQMAHWGLGGPPGRGGVHERTAPRRLGGLRAEGCRPRVSGRRPPAPRAQPASTGGDAAASTAA